MVQVFVGSFFEDKEVDKFVRFAQNFKSETTGRLMRRDKLHLTWLFIGEVEEAQLDFLRSWLKLTMEQAALAAGKNQKVEIIYDSLDGWPNQQAARVVVARPTKSNDWVQFVAAHLLSALEDLRAEQPQIWCKNTTQKVADTERYLTYKPHVTLLRSNPPLNIEIDQGQHLINDLQNQVLPFTQEIRAMHFVRSNAGPDRADYKIIGQIWTASD